VLDGKQHESCSMAGLAIAFKKTFILSHPEPGESKRLFGLCTWLRRENEEA